MASKDDVIQLGLDIDVQSAMREMSRFQRDMTRAIGGIEKRLGQFGKLNEKMNTSAAKGTEAWTDAVDELTEAYSKGDKVVQALQRKLSAAHGDERAALQQELALAQQLNKERNTFNPRKTTRAQRDAKHEKGSIASHRERKDKTKDLWDGAADNFKSGIRSLFSKDVKGALEDGLRSVGKAFQARGESAAARGRLMRLRGSGMMAAGEKQGGAKGMAMQGLGGAMKGIGSLTSKFGPMIQMLSKLGPIMSLAASSVMAVVKAFIDAEAQAKAFQKDILQSASTSEFLAENGRDASAAYEDLAATMKGVRDAAFSLDNIEWGISSEEHKAVLNSLNQEGVSLKRMRMEAELTGRSFQDFAGDMTHVSVAYSRLFGVALGEISNLQGEMMTDLGMSLDQTKLAFAQMNRDATESGIASNKFFAIIRGASQDLSLYNIRMEQATKTLKMLGKVMNARNAQKFMSNLQQGMKNRSFDDRLKTGLLAGPGGAAVMQKDIANKTKNLHNDLATTLQTTPEEIAKRLADPGQVKGLWDEVRTRAGKEKAGALRESAMELGMDKKAVEGGGIVGQAFAMENLGMGASYKMDKLALQGLSGAKDIRSGISSLGMIKTGELLGKSTGELRDMAKLEQAVEDEKNAMLAVAKNDADRQRILSLDEQDIIDSMSQEQKEELSKMAKTDEELARESSKLQSSMMDKLGVLVDFVMNQLYNVLLMIYDGLAALPGFGGGRGKADAIRAAGKTGNMELQKAFGAGGSGDDLAATGVVKGMNAAFDDLLSANGRSESAKFEKELLEKRANKTDGDKSRIAALDKEIAEIASKATAAEGVRDSMLGSVSKMDPIAVNKLMEMAGISEDQRTTAMNTMGEGFDAKQAFHAAGMDEGQILDVLRKTVHSEMKGSDKAAMLGDAGKQLQGAGYYNPDQQKLDEAQAASAEAAAKSAQGLHKDATNDGTLYVRFSTAFLKGDFKRTMEESVLSALRTALFEFYMYSEVDPVALADYVRNNGGDIPGAIKGLGAYASDPLNMGKSAADIVQAPANASGGIVTGITNGMAQVQAAAGEGLASIGRGERIVPAGGGRGGDSYQINVNGVGGRDLARVIEAKVIDGVAEYKRRERFT